MTTEPRIIDGLPADQYHANPALGSTSLKTLATKTPAHWKWEQSHPKTSDAFDLGTVVHSITLEGDDSSVAVVDADSWRTKAAQEERDLARLQGKTPLLKADWTTARRMRDSILAHPLAKAALTSHRAETSIFWEEDGIELKCRPDAWITGIVTDLKTCVSADPRKFGKVAHEFGYHQSNALYVDGVKAATGEDVDFAFILCEKVEPYLVSVVELDVEAVMIGRQLNDRAKRIYRQCMETREWPGYPPSNPIPLPSWAIREAEGVLA